MEEREKHDVKVGILMSTLENLLLGSDQRKIQNLLSKMKRVSRGNLWVLRLKKLYVVIRINRPKKFID